MSTATHAVSRSQPLLRRPLVRVLLGACVVVIAVGWSAFRPDRLFTATTVAEAAPVAAIPAAAAPVAVPPRVTEPAVLSAVPPTVVAQGRFHSNAHTTLGTATVLDLGDGRRVLRLTGFRTSNGPDVRVVLVAAPTSPTTPPWSVRATSSSARSRGPGATRTTSSPHRSTSRGTAR
jgi:hypothetical protein